MKRLRVESCELRVRPPEHRLSAYSQLSTLNSQLLIASVFLSATLAQAATPTPAPPTPAPTVTPTARPKLSGGFGRPAATPSATEVDSGSGDQSDVVRAAEGAKTRRDAKSGVAITNDNLVTDPNRGRLTTLAPRSVPPATTTRAAETPVSRVTAAPTPASTGPTEAEWRERARGARARVEETKQRVAQLETDTKKLENDFYSWDDGSYREGVIKPAWDKKKGELEAARKELAAAEADLADLPEQARKAGALPGWIRE